MSIDNSSPPFPDQISCSRFLNCLILLVTILISTACKPPLQPTQTPSPARTQTLAPMQTPTPHVIATAMAARMDGKLVEENGCLKIDDMALV